MPSSRPLRGTSTARTAAFAALGIALVVVIVLLPRPGARPQEPTAGAPPTDPASTQDPIAWEPANGVSGAAALVDVGEAIERLLEESTAQIRGRSDLDGSVETFVIDVDRTTGSFASLETVGNDDRIEATIEKIETPDMVFIRVIGDDPAATGPWSEIPVTIPEQLEFETTYTLFGRITPDLADLAVMWRTLTLEIQTANEDGRDVVRLVARTDEVSRYLRETGLASMGPSDEIGSSIWEVWLDDGHLVRLTGHGVQFFSGETFRNALIDIEYEATPVSVEPPAGSSSDPAALPHS